MAKLATLPTKLFIPFPRPSDLPRPALLQRLQQGLSGRLTLVSAPAGYGKSTLLCAWARQAGLPAAWLTLDAGDNEPRRFWNHFAAALRGIPSLEQAQVGEALLAQLSEETLPPPALLLGDLLGELTRAGQHFILVLDDFHTLDEAQVLDGLFYLLEQLPPGYPGPHLVVCGRSDPPWPLARLRAGGAIHELRARDLRFTPAETTQFLTQSMRLELGAAQIAELERRTEGWAAGLQLAALSLQGRADVNDFLRDFSGSHRFVLDYLVEEVLNRQDAATLDFLLKTSILERLQAELCDTLTGGHGGAQMLRRLEQANMFLAPLDEQRGWYRYHSLFADLLQKQLQARDPALAPELQRRASQWYAAAGLAQQAVAHALASKDVDFAVEQVQAFVLELIQRGELRLARQWLEALPAERLRLNPLLCVAQVWTAAGGGTVEMAAALLAQAEAALAQGPTAGTALDPETRAQVIGQIAVLQVVLARRRGDPADEQQRLAQAALEQGVPAADDSARTSLLLRLGFSALDLGKDEQADRLFSQAFELGERCGNRLEAHVAAYGSMVVARRHGQLKRLEQLCHSCLQAVGGGAPGAHAPVLAGFAQVMLGGLYYEWNRLEEAGQSLRAGLAFAAELEKPELLVKGYFHLASVSIAQGEPAALPDLPTLAGQGQASLGRYAAALQSRLHLLLAARQGQPRPAPPVLAQWAAAQELAFREQPAYDWEITEKLVLARWLCQQLRSGASMGQVARLRQLCELLAAQVPALQELGWRGILVELQLVLALSCQALGEGEAAQRALAQALELAAEPGFVRLFVDEGEPLSQLLEQAVRDGSAPQIAYSLLEQFASLAQPAAPRTQPGDLIEALSRRELQVLRLLASALPVPELAAEIHLAPTTVRTHIQRLYQKLGVHGRLEALERARQLGLL